MKIGILTYHRALNYGAFLQAFALKSFLESHNHNVTIIDYWPDEHACAYKPLFINPALDSINRIKQTIYNLLRYHKYRKRTCKMDVLRAKYLDIPASPQFKKGQELVNLNYDCVIYGSDQIWWRHSPFPTYPGFDPVFWGEYIPSSSKKIAYAASMGQMDIDSHDKDFIKNALVHFNHISVREEGLRQLLQPLTSKNILTAVDPTLLMGIDFWKKYADAFIPKEKYVLLYNLNPSKAAEQLARKKAQQLNCRYIEITGAVNPLKIGKEYKQTVDAFEFITYIRHAEYVVTTSFHGTAFSIIFEKPFCALGMGNNSSRVSSLLNQLHISQCLIDDHAEPSAIPINYQTVKNILRQIVNPSQKFLLDALENNN